MSRRVTSASDPPPLTLILPPEEDRLRPEELRAHLFDLVRALARQAADEDFERDEARRHLRQV